MNRIRELRKQQGRTIAELAMRLGVTESTLRNWERGRHLPKSAAMRRKVARVLGVTEPALAVEVDAATTASKRNPAPTTLKPLAAAIIPRGDRVLLTNRRFHKHGEVWSWPSGQVEKGETLEDAMIRQLHQELFIDNAHIVRRLGDIDLASGYRMTHFHVVIPDEIDPRLNDYEQLSDVQWMTRDQVEQAFSTLDPSVAARALGFVDDVLTHPAGAASAGLRVSAPSPGRLQ